MLAITPQHKLFICVETIDFRKGIDTLVGYCESFLNQDPFSGRLFIFRNKAGSAIKILVYDKTGFWLCYKRFSSGKLLWWPKSYQEAQQVSALKMISIFSQSKISYEASSWRDFSTNDNVS